MLIWDSGNPLFDILFLLLFDCWDIFLFNCDLSKPLWLIFDSSKRFTHEILLLPILLSTTLESSLSSSFNNWVILKLLFLIWDCGFGISFCLELLINDSSLLFLFDSSFFKEGFLIFNCKELGSWFLFIVFFVLIWVGLLLFKSDFLLGYALIWFGFGFLSSDLGFNLLLSIGFNEGNFFLISGRPFNSLILGLFNWGFLIEGLLPDWLTELFGFALLLSLFESFFDGNFFCFFSSLNIILFFLPLSSSLLLSTSILFFLSSSSIYVFFDSSIAFIKSSSTSFLLLNIFFLYISFSIIWIIL